MPSNSSRSSDFSRRNFFLGNCHRPNESCFLHSSQLTFWKSLNCWYLESLSSWLIPLWMAMAGKFCSISSWASATHLWTLFTKMTTWK